MKLLFIDSNIFLNFYDFHDEDLTQLAKLVDFIKSGEIKLFLTSQVCDEVKRNREVRLKVAYGEFAKSKPTLTMPPFCKHYDEYTDIKRAQNILDKLKAQLSKKLWNDIQKHTLKADKVIQDLISESKIIESDAYLPQSIKRHRLGRPPGKKDRSYGDEINWEALLAEVEGEGEFILLSKDGDYSHPIDENLAKDYLVEEWKKVHPENEIFFYKSLTRFFSEHDIKIQLRVEQEKDSLVQGLINSPNFLTTHDLVSKLSKYSSFNDSQIKGLANALLENSQVRWVINDQDTNSFYREHLLPKPELFDPETWAIIRATIQKEGEETDVELEIKNLEEKIKPIEEINLSEISF